MDRDDEAGDKPVGEQADLYEVTSRRRALVAFILVLAMVDVAYRLVYASGGQRTAALFVGIPALLAIGLVLTPHAGSTTGMILKGSTLAMLIACVVLPEGLICLLFAFPLMALMAVLVGGPIDWARRRRRRQGPTLMAVALPLLLLSLEGVIGSPVDPHERAEATVVVHAPSAAVAAALARTPTFPDDLPWFLGLGFNRPVAAQGSGIAVGDHRTIDFVGGTHDDHPLRLFGGTGERSVDHHADMHLTVVESAPDRVVFAVDHDGTMLGRWLTLRRAIVSWRPAGPDTTEVTWAFDYERLVYPSGYFGPLQRFGMQQAAAYLLDAVVVEPLR